MTNDEIIVHLGLHEQDYIEFEEDNPNIEYEELKKNIGEDKHILVEDLYRYMINSEKDDLNEKRYNENQGKLVEFIENMYQPGMTEEPYFNYKNGPGENDWSTMYFRDKLSKYPDAFHQGYSSDNDEEFGSLDEEVLKEHVYLNARYQATGGEK